MREKSPLELATGVPDDDGRRWHLYTGPVASRAEKIWVGAWRLGFRASDDVVVVDGAPN
ncbi:hypothetical protein [Arthrobacter sp. M4]|uniref:hypothetical protein n=1 Tax=Arthrobacter sp. M4 TaxID=218160 RepID=UPI001CDBED16|nr:hypothetical protein [Arthrobacter sp. M4]MCA4134194.1 hypothetical protein [Arthrobacter sp. M4]